MELAGLFFGSVLASTLAPFGVELLLYYLHESDEYSWVVLLTVATAGNTAGGCLMYGAGWLLVKGISATGWYGKIQRLFRLEGEAMARVGKWGPFALLFSWMPVVGDPLCLAAGYLRLPLLLCVLMILTGKLARYAALLWIFHQS
ncbi:MAG: DedA family protein [Gammaproteobacteria bacterium]|nr:DedA family protein [Gammaproteobacteria bacterium]MYD76541.1 DedA family protein [Gammaproteobacteria bacterium]MYJ52017.1 DedA family protein [Gammaproteobacteria bacterium]